MPKTSLADSRSKNLPTNIVEFKAVDKNFGLVSANQDLHFAIRRGEIHGIIGENGAGKSTAMKMLFGLYHPDAGEIFLNQKPIHFRNPKDAINAGIGMVHQHFMLAEPCSALDNLLLHQESGWLLNRKEELRKLQSLATKFGFEIDLSQDVEKMPVGVQQRLEILKVLSRDPEVIILDEPTAVLPPQEIDSLFQNLRQLQAHGKTIIIVTHKLKEVMQLTDSVTVFRKGKAIAERATKETSASELAELMIGHKLAAPSERKTQIQSKKILSVQNLSARHDLHFIEDINFEIAAGEILGVAGVEGNGQDVLIRSLLDPHSFKKRDLHGHIEIRGKETLKLRTKHIRAMGTSAFPEDRLRYGVLPGRPVFENFLLGLHRLKKFRLGPFVHFKNLISETNQALKNYSVSPQDAHYTVDRMSGGNQQKVVVAREMNPEPVLIIAAQPTRGVDIGAIEFIHEEICRHRDAGSAVLLISSELDELLALSDRMIVLCKGKNVAEFKRAEFDAQKIGCAMGGKI